MTSWGHYATLSCNRFLAECKAEMPPMRSGCRLEPKYEKGDEKYHHPMDTQDFASCAAHFNISEERVRQVVQLGPRNVVGATLRRSSLARVSIATSLPIVGLAVGQSLT